MVQYGFRQTRSTTDCVLMILSALKSAKRKKHCILLAFCDIAKAYDTVCRELLYTKLRHIGFGGRVAALILSRDSRIQFTSRMVGSRDVACHQCYLLCTLHRQGQRQTTQGGVGGGAWQNDSYSLVLCWCCPGPPKHSMNTLLRIVAHFCRDMEGKLSTSKTYIWYIGYLLR